MRMAKDESWSDNFFEQLNTEKQMADITPNGFMSFKTALGTEKEINVCVKISGNICIWLEDNAKLFLPNQDNFKKQAWFKDLVSKYGKYQGIKQRDTKIELPGEPKPNNKLSW